MAEGRVDSAAAELRRGLEPLREAAVRLRHRTECVNQPDLADLSRPGNLPPRAASGLIDRVTQGLDAGLDVDDGMRPTVRGRAAAVGIFDSGIGGIDILVAVRRRLPGRRLLYFADAAFFPYGDRSADEIVVRATDLTRTLLRHGAGVVVVACNTATAAAIATLRARFDVPFVGVVPAVKPAGACSRSRRIAVLATSNTTRAPVLHDLLTRFGGDADIVCLPAPGLADCVERGDLSSPATLRLLDRYLAPAREREVDVLVLGCTHYSFLRGAIERIMGPSVRVIDAGDAVARQVERVVLAAGLVAPATGDARVQYLTSGSPAALAAALARLRRAGVPVPHGPVRRDEGG
jgi:glutamate racemase